MARDKINAEGGLLDEAVTVVAVDNHGSAGDAEAAVKQLTSRHAVAMIGPNLSHCALAVVRDATAAKMPVISPAGARIPTSPSTMGRAKPTSTCSGRPLSTPIRGGLWPITPSAS